MSPLFNRCSNITEMECLFGSFKYLLSKSTLGDMTEQLDLEYVKVSKYVRDNPLIPHDDTVLERVHSSWLRYCRQVECTGVELGHDVTRRHVTTVN